MTLSRSPARLTAGLLVLAGVALTGCPAGKAPPAVTRMIALPETGPAGFRLGSSDLRCDGISADDRCDAGKTKEPEPWIDDLSWVPHATATLAPFWIDEHEVTNFQYAHCVDAGKCAEPAFADIDGTPYYGVADFDDSPVVFVTREDARDYCAFVDKRLPNEAEWEWAARYDGKDNNRIYPYAPKDPGDPLLPPTCTKKSPTYLVSQGCASTPLPADYSEADVTAKGVRNMASNVAEWVEDDWNALAYCAEQKAYGPECSANLDPQGNAISPSGIEKATCACQADGALCARSCDPRKLVICKGGSYALQRVQDATVFLVRGGSYMHSRCALRLFVRRKESRPAGREIGFRCARSDPPPAEQRL